MSIETAADRAAFLADFGVSVSWVVGVAAPVTVTALFDSGAIVQDLQDGAGLINRRGTITFRADDLPASGGGASDALTIAGTTYHPKSMLPDGQGMIVMTLEVA